MPESAFAGTGTITRPGFQWLIRTSPINRTRNLRRVLRLIRLEEAKQVPEVGEVSVV